MASEVFYQYDTGKSYCLFLQSTMSNVPLYASVCLLLSDLLRLNPPPLRWCHLAPMPVSLHSQVCRTGYTMISVSSFHCVFSVFCSTICYFEATNVTRMNSTEKLDNHLRYKKLPKSIYIGFMLDQPTIPMAQRQPPRRPDATKITLCMIGSQIVIRLHDRPLKRQADL